MHFRFGCYRPPSRLPLFLYCTERFGEDGLLSEGFGEFLDQWAEAMLWHIWDEFIEHAGLPEERVGAPLGGIGFEMPVVAKGFAGGSKQGEQSHGKGIEEPQAIAPIWGADMDGAHPHAEAQIFGIAEPWFDGPAFRVEIDQVARGIIGGAGGKASRLLVVSQFEFLVLYTFGRTALTARTSISATMSLMLQSVSLKPAAIAGEQRSVLCIRAKLYQTV